MPYIVTEDCILCGACVAGCPSGAIEEDETQSRINVEICIECGTCEQNCPVNAIIFVEAEELAASQPQQGGPGGNNQP